MIGGVFSSAHALDTAVANVPCGSGNDFIKGLTDIKDPAELLLRYRKQKTRIIDLGIINDRCFINIASIGFDAEIVYNAKKYKRLPMLSAGLAYLISVFTTLVRLKDYPVRISIDNEKPWKKQTLFITMANGKYYGGGMQPAPKAQLDDGLLDFCIIDKIPRWKVPYLLPKFIKGKHEMLKEVKMVRGRKIYIRSHRPLPVNIDGEISWSDKVNVEIRNRAIKVLVP